jgi:hypothetical protein
MLVNVVVHSLTGDDRRFRGGMGRTMDNRCIFILGCITIKKPLNFFVVAVLKRSFFSR